MSNTENQATTAILKISQVLNQHFAVSTFGQKAKKYSRMEWYILNLISLQPNTTEKDLHQLIPADGTKIRRAIRKLGRARLIYKAENTSEEKSLLELTPKGKRECEKAEQIDVQIVKDMLKNVNPKDIPEFKIHLKKLLIYFTPKTNGKAVTS